jgi:hypothetical protein
LSSSGELCQVSEGLLGALEVVSPELKTCLLVKSHDQKIQNQCYNKQQEESKLSTGRQNKFLEFK